jgi:hypothetical protein
MTTLNQAVRRFLRSRKFKLRPRSPGAIATYEGPLPFRGGEVPVLLDIIDWDFRELPEIRVLRRPELLSGFRAHLGLGSRLCYMERESVLLDAYDPVGTIAGCLKEAAETLEDIAGNRHRAQLQDEFVVNWSGTAIAPIMLWRPSSEQRRMLSALFVDLARLPGTWIITDDVERTKSALASAGATIQSVYEGAVVELTSSRAPAIDPDHWPPQTFKEVLQWMKGWDESLERLLRGRLESLWSKSRPLLIVLVGTPLGRFGFEFKVKYRDSASQAYYAKRRPDRGQFILRQNPSIERFRIADLSPRFVHGRNQPDRENLAGKRIVLIGAGTVGGYLCTLLARLGAGLEGGSITVFDPQLLFPENLGRHVLPLSYLFANKAEGVAELVRHEFPYLSVKGVSEDALRAKNLFDADIIINATGSSGFSTALNREHLARLKASKPSPPVLHLWVEGPGDAARSLLVESLKGMCYECLLRRQSDQVPQDRFPISMREVAVGREHPGGCGSYMPFAVSSSVVAASLGLDAVRDWARGEAGATLRSRRLDRRHTQNREDSSPSPLKTCPACRPK